MWPHAPVHRFDGATIFMVTSATLYKRHLFQDDGRLEIVQHELFTLAEQYQWQLEAWAIFSNHYHFVARCVAAPQNLGRFLGHLHGNTARQLNRLDDCAGRQVWYQSWDTRLTYEKSYLARLRYTHQNPVRHGLVTDARDYRFCSASWFEKTAATSFVRTLESFPIDRLNVPDDF